MSPPLDVLAAGQHLGAPYSFIINTAQNVCSLSTSNAFVIDSTRASSEWSPPIAPSISLAHIFF